MSDSQLKMSRRTALKRTATLAAGVVAAPLLFVSADALAKTKTIPSSTWRTASEKTVVHYRAQPNGNQRCADCDRFTAGKTADSDGYCKVVEAMITPNGWCNCYISES